MTRVRVEADVPPDLVQSLLQAIRTWEAAHAHVQMAIVIEDDHMEVRTAQEIFRSLAPPFAYEKIVETRRKQTKPRYGLAR
jgi:hypothetical protein